MKQIDAEMERRMVFARQKAAQAWCTTETSSIPMDVILCEAFAEILVVYMYEPHMGCVTTGELLDEIKVRVDLGYLTVGGEK